MSRGESRLLVYWFALINYVGYGYVRLDRKVPVTILVVAQVPDWG